jgi:hypothetical protein
MHHHQRSYHYRQRLINAGYNMSHSNLLLLARACEYDSQLENNNGNNNNNGNASS